MTTMNTDEFFAEAKRLNLRMLGTPEEIRAALDLKDAEIAKLRAALSEAPGEEREAFEAWYQRALLEEPVHRDRKERQWSAWQARAMLAARPSVPQGEPVAWAHADGRVVPASTMEAARRDGGAMMSSLRDYTVPLYARPSAPTVALTEEQIRADERQRVVRAIRGVQAAYDARFGPGPSVQASACSDCIGAVHGIGKEGGA